MDSCTNFRSHRLYKSKDIKMTVGDLLEKLKNTDPNKEVLMHCKTRKKRGEIEIQDIDTDGDKIILLDYTTSQVVDLKQILKGQ